MWFFARIILRVALLICSNYSRTIFSNKKSITILMDWTYKKRGSHTSLLVIGKVWRNLSIYIYKVGLSALSSVHVINHIGGFYATWQLNHFSFPNFSRTFSSSPRFYEVTSSWINETHYLFLNDSFLRSISQVSFIVCLSANVFFKGSPEKIQKWMVNFQILFLSFSFDFF